MPELLVLSNECVAFLGKPAVLFCWRLPQLLRENYISCARFQHSSLKNVHTLQS